MMESTALGAAIVAGRALRVWPTSTPSPPADIFLPSVPSEGKLLRGMSSDAREITFLVVQGTQLETEMSCCFLVTAI